MVDEEENRIQPALWGGDVTEKGLGISPAPPSPKVLFTRKAYLPWLAAAWAAAPLTLNIGLRPRFLFAGKINMESDRGMVG